MQAKRDLRKRLREERRAHVEALPDAIRGLLFRQPPNPVLERIAPDAVIGLYHANSLECPTANYAGFFIERGHAIALPRFAGKTAPMEFAAWTDPFGDSDLEVGPFGLLQPGSDAEALVPDVLFMPLVGFTQDGHRLGQGGGHYDRWLADHPGTLAIGLAWDAQLCDELPCEEHDRILDAVVTPTRLFEVEIS
ncbi:5-formyltetrahydrofolate cyclo-ligase [Erythrobacter sp. HKB08]|uniref:5-formyltetrahydrofolate cyclo-ligase n=1 Tax=Erythrobacter sp. HKB08 TaxID=2502843 RepID=UPI0010086FC5|nr:5-formyltetrahydrofolate cyclo-ligase [Erythrobacter sp. HKB08]